LEDDIFKMESRSVANIIQRGGTILKTARCKEFYEPEGRKKAYDILKKRGIDALVIIGGDGSFRGIALPDVILLDLKLPKMDGHEVLAKIKADEKLRRIPVIVLTTSDAEVDKIRAYQLHANSYLVKPIDAEQFNKMVQDMSLYWGSWNRSPESV